jgi:hypothetical protein
MVREEFRASSGYAPAIAPLARLYAVLARRLPPDARAQVVADLIEEFRAHRGDAQALHALAVAEQYTARTLPAELGRQFAGTLLEELTAAHGDPTAVFPLAMAFSATVPASAPERADAALIVLEEIDRSRGTVFVGWLAEMYATLTLARPAELAGRAEALRALLDELSRAGSQGGGPPEFDGSLRSLFELCGTSDCFALFAGAVLDSAAALPFESRAALVVELLKVPASTRLRLTETLLARLRAEPGAETAGPPDGGLWEFVAWADERGLQSGRPLDPERIFETLTQ